jgi:hypothetical protein
MKVKELIEFLAGCDAEATVILTIQPRWPLEYDLAGVAIREECRHDAGHIRSDPGQSPNDVILVEGKQVGYGEREAWDVAARPRRHRR